MIDIKKLITVPQAEDPRYYWIYGLGSDNRIYVWHSKKGHWVLHKFDG